MYQAFYRLKADPFRLSPDHAFCYRYPSFSKGRAYMQYALNAAEGFVVITGRPGMGKTTLINDLLADFGPDDHLVATLVNTLLEANDLLRTVAYEFGLGIEGLDKATVLQRLKQLFVSSLRAGRPPLLIVDEAQNLSLQALEELRLLTNLQLDGKPLLQIFLVGQEDLRDKLADRRLEQLRQRITAAAHLEPLSEVQTAAYIVHRLKVVGWEDFPRIKSSVLPIIHATSEGVPRRINQFCSRLLLHGSVEEKAMLDAEDARVVVAELGDERLTSADAGAVSESALGAGSGLSDLTATDEASILDAAEPLLRQQRAARRTSPPPLGVVSSPRPQPAGVPDPLVPQPRTRPVPMRDFPPYPEAVPEPSRRRSLLLFLILLAIGVAVFAVARFGAHKGWLLDPLAVDGGSEPSAAPSAVAPEDAAPRDTLFSGGSAAVSSAIPRPALGDQAGGVAASPPDGPVRGPVPESDGARELSERPADPVVLSVEPPPVSADRLSGSSVADIRADDEARGTPRPARNNVLPALDLLAATPAGDADDDMSVPSAAGVVAARAGGSVAASRPPPTRQIGFGFDSAEIRTGERLALDELATELQNSGARIARIIGSADGSGSPSYNQVLSRRRAEAVVDYLVGRGIERSRLRIEAGEAANPQPTVAPGRFVEIRIEASP